MKKVFRVLIGETQGFYIDIEADSPDEAKQLAREGIDNNTQTPIEDKSVNTGYQIEDAEEIKREDADLSN